MELTPQQKALQNEYRARINRVIDYIQHHLDAELTLEKLSREAAFSPFHFHRIFQFQVGETLNRFINRIRVEKAAMQLVYNPKNTVTEIALSCGFSSSSTFARAFHDWYGMSATEWRRGGHKSHSKIRKSNSKTALLNSNQYEVARISMNYSTGANNNLSWRLKMIDQKDIQVEVKEREPVTIAYVRHIGAYQSDGQLFEQLFNRLMQWAGPRNLLRFPETEMYSIYYDDPEITDDEKLRVDVCITVPEGTEASGEVGISTLPGGKYGVGHFEVTEQEYGQAWKVMFGDWLPQSGYQPDDRPSFEHYLNNPEEHPEKKHIVDIYIPIKPL